MSGEEGDWGCGGTADSHLLSTCLAGQHHNQSQYTPDSSPMTAADPHSNLGQIATFQDAKLGWGHCLSSFNCLDIARAFPAHTIYMPGLDLCVGGSPRERAG